MEEEERIGERKLAKKMYSPLRQNGRHSFYLNGYTQLLLYGITTGLVPDHLHDKRIYKYGQIKTRSVFLRFYINASSITMKMRTIIF